MNARLIKSLSHRNLHVNKFKDRYRVGSGEFESLNFSVKAIKEVSQPMQL